MRRNAGTFPALCILVGVFAFSSLTSCASTPKNRPGLLFGMIYDLDGSPVRDATITLGPELVAMSDANGRFMLEELAPGRYEGLVEKTGYESVPLNLDYRNEADVVYVKLPSRAQILVLMEKAIANVDWPSVRALLVRADAIPGLDPLQEFLRAIVALRDPEASVSPEAAIQGLTSLITEGYREPALFTLLADIHEYRLHDAGSALAALKLIPQERLTPALVERMQRLENSLDDDDAASVSP